MKPRAKRVYPNLQAYLADLTRQGTTQEAFAARIGISPGHLSEIKNGNQRPSFPLAKRLADECGIPIESFLENTRSVS